MFIFIEAMLVTHPNKKSIDDWYQDIKNPKYGLEWVLKHRPTLEPDAKQILDKAVNKYEQEQEDIRNAPREQREKETLKLAQDANRYARMALVLSGVAIIITLVLALTGQDVQK